MTDDQLVTLGAELKVGFDKLARTQLVIGAAVAKLVDVLVAKEQREVRSVVTQEESEAAYRARFCPPFKVEPGRYASTPADAPAAPDPLV